MDTKTLPNETTDPDTIQEWAEIRGGTPVRDLNDPSELKIVFDKDNTDMSNLEEISWSEFFELFEENECKFYYRDQGELAERDEQGEETSQEELDDECRIEKNAR